MVTNCLSNIKRNLKGSAEVYNGIAEEYAKHKPFDYGVERSKKYSEVSLYLGFLLTNIKSWEVSGKFLDEVGKNWDNPIYFINLNHVFKNYFDFLTNFSEALYLYSNDKVKTKNLLDALCGKDEEYFPFMFDRTPDDLNAIKQHVKAEYHVEDQEAIDMIIHQDTLWKEYEVENIVPKKLSKEELLQSIQVFYILVYDNLERWVASVCSKFECKFNSEDYKDSLVNTDEFISLRYGAKNEEIISKIYDAIKGKNIDCSLEEFRKIFYPGQSKVKWSGGQGNLALLFKGDNRNALKVYNINIFKALAFRFKSQQGKDFKYQQLSVSLSKSNISPLRNSKHIEKFLSSLSN